MAKGPGPALFLAAAAAFMLMGRKKETPPVSADDEGSGEGNGANDDGVGGGPAGSGGSGGSSGGSSGSGYVSPPNITGDPEGYNSGLYTGYQAIREVLSSLGYSIPVNSDPIGSKTSKNAAALKFQQNYNRGANDGLMMSRGPLSGQPITGKLKEDGWPGDDTLNAMELAYIGFADGAWSSIFSL